MKIYTRTGDGGDTSLFDGQRVRKHDPRPDAYGTIDELNAVIGLAAAHCRHPSLVGQLESIQSQLLELGAELANPGAGPKRITPEMVAGLERMIDRADEELPPLTGFILPGGSPTAAALHQARTVCRRAERKLTRLRELGQQPPGDLAMAYVNRLSDTLFTLARLANLRDQTPEKTWTQS
jgi:cob(I)alamin adenosyltransferase